MNGKDQHQVSVIDLHGSVGERAPVLPAPAAERADATREVLPALRRFHRGDPGAAVALDAPDDDTVPALLHAGRTPGRAGDAPYVFVLSGADEELQCQGLTALVHEAVVAVGPAADDDPVLKDALTRFERGVRAALAERESLADASSTLQEALHAIEEERTLDFSIIAALRSAVEHVSGALPPEARLIALDEHTPLSLFLLAAEHRARSRHERLREDVTRLRRLMRDLLRAERAKRVDSSRPEALQDTVGDAGAVHVDVEMLASVLGAPRGVESLDPGRRDRIEIVSGILERFLAQDEPPLVHVVGHGEVPKAIDRADVAWHSAPVAGVFRTAMALFDDEARRYAEVFGALRVARLLEAGAYDPARHDPLLDAFEPDAFSAEELHALTPIVALESVRHLAGAGMIELSSLLRRGHPVHVIVPVQPASDPGVAREADPLSGYRFELAYVGISHREAVVHQSSAARPEHLVRGFAEALDATHASLHVVTSGLTAEGIAPRLGSWMHTGAALEGRAHPFVRYNPEAGETWARRIDIGGNPQPDGDWPVYELDCRDVNGNPQSIPLAFTFADYALLEHRYCDHFRVIPDACDHDDLVLLGAYLGMDPEEAEARLPFIWSANAEGQMHRLLVSRRLAFACRDRLDYWRTLQELAGVRNEYVREAVERERDRLEADFNDERQRLEAEHGAALDAVRREAAQEAMQRLARALLSTDSDSAVSMLAPGGGTPDAASPGAASPAAAPVESAPPVESPPITAPPASSPPAPVSAPEAPVSASAPGPDDDEPEEPWIDTVLCTSCNDCIQINGQLFVYNRNKQATIGDAQAGTFAQLVQAAEKCPAKCIHPGTPLDPSEPGLEGLVERAKKFG